MPIRLTAIVASFLFVVACSGGDDDGDDDNVGDDGSSPEQTGQASPIVIVQDSQLAIMALPLDRYGADLAGLEIDEESGFVDNDAATEDTIDPEDTVEEIDASGRINGYALNYEQPGFEGVGDAKIFSVSSTIDLFRDEDSASRFMAEQLADYQEFQGEDLGGGIIFTDYEELEGPELGEESTYAKANARFGDTELYGSFVVFRVGSVLAGVTVSTLEDADVSDLVISAGEQLLTRVDGALARTLDETPVPIPVDDEPADRPLSAPYPDRMVLAAEDLPNRARISDEGYVEDERAESSFEREMSLPGVKLGTSDVFEVRSNVRLYESALGATTELEFSRGLLESEGGQELFAASIARSFGGEAEDVELTLIEAPGIGDEAVGARLVLGSNVGVFEMVFYYIQVDRVFGIVMLMGPEGGVKEEDARPLAEKMAQKMQAELEAN